MSDRKPPTEPKTTVFDIDPVTFFFIVVGAFVVPVILAGFVFH
ncbi:hypothetical protein CKA32_001503 [Geitlerinema sp. FC II]|nr:hypothetical protein [Baaleninema simplex]MDC0834055.1 hypothetical protein [Geitlerinema sp. CS-897]PPT04855.1 hypothetical protein CKA32_001503 [Geitlerinema sp. FC II]